MLTLIAHTTPEPALYGALAAILAELRALSLCHLPVSYDAKRFAHGRQYVTSQGQEITSGLVWLERLTGRDAGNELPLPSLINRAMKEDIVLPVNVDLHSAYCDDIALLAAEHGIAIERLQVVKQQGRFQLEDGDSGKVRSNGWTQDRFGRWVLGAWSQPVMRAGNKLRLGLVGDISEHRDSYPATLAALGDAADALAMDIDVVYINPGKLGGQLEARLFELDGILLSGLGDMHGHNAAGQLAVARWALETHTPIMGINQGMHLMVAALAWHLRLIKGRSTASCWSKHRARYIPTISATCSAWLVNIIITSQAIAVKSSNGAAGASCRKSVTTCVSRFGRAISKIMTWHCTSPTGLRRAAAIGKRCWPHERLKTKPLSPVATALVKMLMDINILAIV